MINTVFVFMSSLKELNRRAQSEVTIREAIRELTSWYSGVQFQLTEYQDSSNNTMMLIKDWKDMLAQVRHTYNIS